MAAQVVTFDLDGTLTDCTHRQELVTCAVKDRDWRAFHKMSIFDTPIQVTVNLLKDAYEFGHEIWIWSARDEAVRFETISWLIKHSLYHMISWVKLKPYGCRLKDYELKESWLLSLSEEDRKRILFFVEDRQKVADRYIENGHSVFLINEKKTKFDIMKGHDEA